MLCWPRRSPFNASTRFPGGTLRSVSRRAPCRYSSFRRATRSMARKRGTSWSLKSSAVSALRKDRITPYRVLLLKHYVKRKRPGRLHRQCIWHHTYGFVDDDVSTAGPTPYDGTILDAGRNALALQASALRGALAARARSIDHEPAGG